MEISKRQWLIGGGALLVIIAALSAGNAWRSENAPVSGSPTASTTGATAVGTSTLVGEPQQTAAANQPFPINKADTIASWSFKGAYSGNATLTAHAQADIVHLRSLLGKGEYDDYDLYIGMGNDANLLGDGKSAYDAYNRAVAIHPGKGLAYANIGHLMDELGAYHTAADAYAKAVAVEPSMLEYQLQRLTFLTQRFPNDNALILAAFTDASNEFGDSAPVLAIEAQWLTGQGRYADAIKAWQTVKMLSPKDRQASIDAEIARLQAKLQ